MGGCTFLKAKNISKVLEKFNMVDAKPVATPLVSHLALSTKQSPTIEVELEEMKKISYTSTVGCLMYAMVYTRPSCSSYVCCVKIYVKFRETTLACCQVDSQIFEKHKKLRHYVLKDNMKRRVFRRLRLCRRLGQTMAHYRLYFQLWRRAGKLEVYAPFSQCFVNYKS